MESNMIRSLSVFLVSVIVLVAVLEPAIALSDAKVAILSVAAVPHGAGESQVGSSFVYPDVQSIDIQITLRLDAEDARKVTVFAAGKDQDGWRIGKGKISEIVEPGETTIVLGDFVKLDNFFGEHDVTLEVEVSCSGAPVVRTRRSFSFTGVPEPVVKVDYSDLRPRDEPLYIEFVPGESFSLNLFYEIEENPAELDLVLRIFAVMDEQDFEIDNYSFSDPFWGETDIESEPGFYHVEFHGRLPDRFLEFYRERHYFRVIVVLDFEEQIGISEPVEGLIYDEFYGDNREPYSSDEALIKLERASRWRIDRLSQEIYRKRIRDLRELKRHRRFELYFGY